MLTDTSFLRMASRDTRKMLREAVTAIDEQFGEGYAAANPQLVAGYLNAAVTLFGARFTAMDEPLFDVATPEID